MKRRAVLNGLAGAITGLLLPPPIRATGAAYARPAAPLLPTGLDQASGDGHTADTRALNAALLVAQRTGGPLQLEPGRTYLISDFLRVRNGVRALIGNGATIRCVRGSTAGILLQGRESGVPENVQGCTIADLIVDLNGTQGFGIYGQNCSGCEIVDNRIIGASRAQSGILIRSFDRSGGAASANLIAGNIVDGTGNPGAAGIQVDSAGRGLFPPAGNRLRANRTIGWQYGVGLGGAPRTNIEGHVGVGALRVVSAQNGCDGSTISGVEGIEYTGTCVHIVNSNGVRVSDSTARSRSIVYGEGGFQAMRSVEDCLFENCRTEIPTSAGSGPEFHFYAGASASRTIFRNCSASGVAARAYFMIESAYRFEDPPRLRSPFGRNKSGVGEEDATADTVDAGFEDCQASGASPVPAFALLQVTTRGGRVRRLVRPFIRRCRAAAGNFSHHLYLHEETPGALIGPTLVDNVVDRLRVRLPRGGA